MEDLERTKENIQPLRSGRNIEQLEKALHSDAQLSEERRSFEQRIENYDGTDPLQPWYEFICWIEQTSLASGRQMGNNEILLKCIAKFENDERYLQDHRFIKLCIKYIDTQSSPQELYQELYDRGIGTLCAELYIGWAYYYDAEDNFAKTENIYQKGFDAGAKPKEDMEQAHKQFGFSMSQRLLHKDESSKQKFQTTLAERRNALTSLKPHKKKHVGTLRTGLAVRSFNPGSVKQENVENFSNNTDDVAIYTGSSDDKESVFGAQSINHSLINPNRNRENVREPGPWSNAKNGKKHGPLFSASHCPSFAISEDTYEYQPIPILVENLSKGIQLETNHKNKNYPQKSFDITACDDDKPAGFPMYGKISLYCRAPKYDFSPEELHGYHYFRRRRIYNKMTEHYDDIWGESTGIRLHPYHVRQYKFNPGNDLKTEKPTIDGSVEGLRTKVKDMYADIEELSMEELRLQKWKDGKIKRYIDTKNDDDMLRVDMDETVVQAKRVSIAPARVSFAPLHSDLSRKSVFPQKTNMSMISEEQQEELSVAGGLNLQQPGDDIGKETSRYTGAIKKSDIYKRRSEESPGIKSVPKKKVSLDALEQGIPDPPEPKQGFKIKIPIFLDEEDTANNKDGGYLQNETCSTQIFNMFVNTQSTPVALKHGGMRRCEQPVPHRDQGETDGISKGENQAQVHQLKFNDENVEPASSTPPNINTTEAQKQLSTIMERTETSSTSVAFSSKSSVSSPTGGDANGEDRCMNASNANVKCGAKNVSPIVIQPTLNSGSNETLAFKTPGTATKPLPTGAPKLAECPVEVFKPVPVPKTSSNDLFIIHVDSTETMAKIPLVSKSAIAQKVPNGPIEDKENKQHFPEATYMQSEDTTSRTTTNLLRKNISHLPQAKTPSPKAKKIQQLESASNENAKKIDHRMNSPFDLAVFQKTPEKKLNAPNIHLKEQNVPSFLPTKLMIDPTNYDNASKPIIIQSVMGQINLADFPSPKNRHSIEDMNTEIFSLDMNNIKNSTLLPEFSLDIPGRVAIEISPGDKKPTGVLDYDISMSELGMKKMTLTDKNGSDPFKKPAPIFKSPPSVIEINDGDSDDLGKSIYVPKQPISNELQTKWEEIDEHFNPANNEYMKKEVDLDGTMQFIYHQTHLGEMDPFDTKLQEAFLEKLDFMSYIEELPTCVLVNKVQPLSKGMVTSVRDTKFTVIKKIGEGTFGTVYSGRNQTSGEIMAMKQERPANLWEYYICLELRCRINNDDILPGLMSVDYAIVGNNASILISPFSRFGNILDVCNTVKRATNKNFDEFIAMIITSQILSIIDHLHSCMIIHADIKPDNFLLMAPINVDSRLPCVQLIDFGVSIDLKLFPKDTTFTKVVTTECFTCIEMLERRPWKFQPDLYGVAGTTHVMLFGRYMEVQKDIVNWNIKTRMPRYFRKPVWDNYFTTLLNIRDCNEMPNLQALRGNLLAEIEENDKYIRDKVSEFNQAILSV
ncbi:uncharacterized protein LOC129776553 isoform X2 [Toxorhynchites rutilus septentrionalis]|uniref:uncharacterized protein LOC129776553 isoform X2 n=1 Tax=Toxorhynchites rutilus septentrionalis TaxID=329112 RepID=UPI002478B407|nr:uncharacterized protein LOC129776553 isoform X2 [Toxorhynchites rutilus septentrionalis]